MDAKRYAKIEEIFAAAAELPVTERPAFLAWACEGSDGLQAHIERLLEADENDAFFDEPAVQPPDDWEKGWVDGWDELAVSAQPSTRTLRVYISSTSERLEEHQKAACEAVREHGMEVVLREDGLVSDCARQVARSDVLLAIVGWQGGEAPAPELGGDGLRPWAAWELRCAFECGKPVTVLMADDTTRDESHDPDARSVHADLRGELARLATFFDGTASLDNFRELVRKKLEEAQPEEDPGLLEDSTTINSGRSGDWDLQEEWERGDFRLRTWPRPKLPERPYPLLLPYAHPDLLAGRREDQEEIVRLLRQPIPIVGLSGPTGVGKSSLLSGGLVPELRAAGQPVAFDRHPLEAGLTARLLGDLLEGGSEIRDSDFRGFIDRLIVARRLAGTTPLLIVDQVDELLSRRRLETQHGRAVLGLLLAASAQRLPGLEEPPGRWLLGCREELLGDLFQWLADVLHDARVLGIADVETLPHDFSGATRFLNWPLRPLGAQGTPHEVFYEVITKPLEARDENGDRRYPWVFAHDGASRLAEAFADARRARPGASLVPELQAVLAHLLDEAGEPPEGTAEEGTVEVEVPEDPSELIDKALERHLWRALEHALPSSTQRTQALLVLRELADETLAPMISREHGDLLEHLATPQTRLVTRDQHDGEWVYSLAQKRLADVLVRLFEEDRFALSSVHGGADAGVDAELLRLRRFVALRTALFTSGEEESATEVDARFQRVGQNADILLQGENQRLWWTAARERWRRQRRESILRQTLAALFLGLLVLSVWSWESRLAERRALRKQVASGEPEAAFSALTTLTSGTFSDDEILALWGQREQPFDVFEQGLGGVGPEKRAQALVHAAKLAAPLLEASPENPESLASLVWALDFFALPDPAWRDEAWALREAALAPLRAKRPPPLAAQRDWAERDWAELANGTFTMGGPGEDGPRHEVTLSAFRILRHEVTNGEYRRLQPDHARSEQVENDTEDATENDTVPATGLTWYEAYTYAAWLGGRLPTEAEWEYAAQAGCSHLWCLADGSAASVNQVAWWRHNTIDPTTGHLVKKRGRQLAPNAWGLFDMLGNAGEWCADWYLPYSEAAVMDPSGGTSDPMRRRNWRGGNFQIPKDWLLPTARYYQVPERGGVSYGLRVVIPLSWPTAAP